MIRNGIIRGLLALVAFGFFVSCQPSGSNPSGGFAPETISADDMKTAIRVITEAFERNEGSNVVLTSFVIEGQSLGANREFESTMLFKFDGSNSFYRKDVWQGDTMESWETYDKNNQAAPWTIVRGGETRTDAWSEMYDQLSYISLSDNEIEAAVPDENHYYNFTVGTKRVKLGFSDSKLRYIDMRENLHAGEYEYELYVKDYGETVVIPNHN